MRKLLLADLIVVFLIWLQVCRSAEAFDPPNVPLYPYPEYQSAVVNEIKATNRATYQTVDNYGWASWRSIAQQSLDTGSAYADSLGNTYHAAVNSLTLREAQASETPTITLTAESAAAQATHCNDTTGWSVACAFLLSPTPAPTYFKAATMQLYGFVSQAAVVIRDDHHISRACDQYIGGCPRKSDGVWLTTVACTGNPDTVMDCGNGARSAQPYDVQVFLLATGFTQTPPCGIGTGNPAWDSCNNWWVFSDGWKFKPNPGCGEWYNPQNQLVWGACDTWGGGARWNNVLLLWLARDGGEFNPANGRYFNIGSAIPIP